MAIVTKYIEYDFECPNKLSESFDLFARLMKNVPVIILYAQLKLKITCSVSTASYISGQGIDGFMNYECYGYSKVRDN